MDRRPPGMLQGLTSAEAADRLRSDGPNELPRARTRGLPQIVIGTMREPMFALLIGAAALYLTIGDLGEGLFLLVGAVASIGLVIMQEARSERALAALRELAQPQVRAIRDGQERRITARDLVRGDLFLIGEGERAPADGLVVSGDVLGVDESALTGESAPVLKRVAVKGETFPAAASPGETQTPFLFAGTVTVRGQAAVQVSRTGPSSALGRIGASLAEMGEQQTPLQRKAGRVVGLLSLAALGFCALVVFAYGVLRDDWIGGVLAGVTVAISLIPEEFPMVFGGVPGARRLATGSASCARTPKRGDRGAWPRLSSLRRQDRDADPKSHARRPVVDTSECR